MKEQCLVLFPYTAQNEDELTLEEGQTILIIRLYLYFVLVSQSPIHVVNCLVLLVWQYQIGILWVVFNLIFVNFSREVEDKGWWKGEVDGRWENKLKKKCTNTKTASIVQAKFLEN